MLPEIVEFKMRGNIIERVAAGDKRVQKRAMHPSNKYAEKPPDFSVLASKDPSFREYVTFGPNKKPRIDWTDFSATRELTRALLEHDYGIKWWIPDGQLCPTVPNRANYIHWIEDLLALSSAPWHTETPSQVRGVDIGTGANCIYPLLGAALNGWHFVATDITPVALEWAQRNLQRNPHLSECIEVRSAVDVREEAVAIGPGNRASSPINPEQISDGESHNEEECPPTSGDYPLQNPSFQAHEEAVPTVVRGEEERSEDWSVSVSGPDKKQEEDGLRAGSEGDVGRDPLGNAPVLVGVVRNGEKFDFCMCNPPFFEDIQEAGLNPRTACGGTVPEMVYPGGELAFITEMVHDSLQLQRDIHWYTSMVGRKVNIKLLTATLRGSGVTMLRTTEFVQGRTSRWGIAWSFSPAPTQTQVASIPGRSLEKSNISFMLEGVDRNRGAWDVLQALGDQLRQCGVTVTIDAASFCITGTASHSADELNEIPASKKSTPLPEVNVEQKSATFSFKASVLQQAPGSLVIKSSLSKAQRPSSSSFER